MDYSVLMSVPQQQARYPWTIVTLLFMESLWYLLHLFQTWKTAQLWAVYAQWRYCWIWHAQETLAPGLTWLCFPHGSGQYRWDGFLVPRRWLMMQPFRFWMVFCAPPVQSKLDGFMFRYNPPHQWSSSLIPTQSLLRQESYRRPWQIQFPHWTVMQRNLI